MEVYCVPHLTRWRRLKLVRQWWTLRHVKQFEWLVSRTVFQLFLFSLVTYFILFWHGVLRKGFVQLNHWESCACLARSCLYWYCFAWAILQWKRLLKQCGFCSLGRASTSGCVCWADSHKNFTHRAAGFGRLEAMRGVGDGVCCSHNRLFNLVVSFSKLVNCSFAWAWGSVCILSVFTLPSTRTPQSASLKGCMGYSRSLL